MLPIFNYDVYIFDCDGVILDSNNLKLDAMSEALRFYKIPDNQVNQSIEYFRNNFGLSRYKHVRYFIDNIFSRKVSSDELYESILKKYAENCVSLYHIAKINDGFIEFIKSISSDKHCYIASGSDQDELRGVFSFRNLDEYFSGIYGSPKAKCENVKDILNKHVGCKTLMFGDALSDLKAAKTNNIEFIFVSGLALAPLAIRTDPSFSGYEITDFNDLDRLEIL